MKKKSKMKKNFHFKKDPMLIWDLESRRCGATAHDVNNILFVYNAAQFIFKQIKDFFAFEHRVREYIKNPCKASYRAAMDCR